MCSLEVMPYSFTLLVFRLRHFLIITGIIISDVLMNNAAHRMDDSLLIKTKLYKNELFTNRTNNNIDLIKSTFLVIFGT